MAWHKRKNTMQRCGWVTQDPVYLAYHDDEWGRPQRDKQALFEMLCLEGQQAGLSWITVLKNAKITAPRFTSLNRKPLRRWTIRISPN